MAWHDYIRVAGSPGDTPGNEVFQGIGALSLKAERDLLINVLSTWDSQIASWCSGVWLWISEQQDNFAAGLPIDDVFPVSDLNLDTLTRTNLYYLSSEYFGVLVLRTLLHGLFNGVLHALAQSVVHSLVADGSDDPMTALFKKFAFLREDDPVLGFEDLTSILLLNADKPLEVGITHSGVDVFMDSVLLRPEE